MAKRNRRKRTRDEAFTEVFIDPDRLEDSNKGKSGRRRRQRRRKRRQERAAAEAVTDQAPQLTDPPPAPETPGERQARLDDLGFLERTSIENTAQPAFSAPRVPVRQSLVDQERTRRLGEQSRRDRGEAPSAGPLFREGFTPARQALPPERVFEEQARRDLPLEAIPEPRAPEGRPEQVAERAPQQTPAWMEDEAQVQDVLSGLISKGIQGQEAPGPGIVPYGQIPEEVRKLVPDSFGTIVGFDPKTLDKREKELLARFIMDTQVRSQERQAEEQRQRDAAVQPPAL
jgi:hypothetical protein